MDFTPTEAQRDLAELTRRIAADHPPAEPVGSGGFDRNLWTALGGAGVLDAALPAHVGGGGFGVAEQCSVLAELGRAVAAVPYLPTITMAATTLAEHADGETLERWLVPIVRGARIVAPALPETGAPVSFTLTENGHGFATVSGQATAVEAGAFADGFLLQASSADGDVLALVAADAPGLRVERQQLVDHADAALVHATDVRPDAVLPPASVPWLRRRGVLGACARQLGVLERALELTAAYAAERTQFGKPIGGFQAVRHRLADAYLDVDAVRLTLWQAAWLLAEHATTEPAHGTDTSETVGTELDAAIATAKYWAAEAGHRVAHTAVHVHGGVGIDVEHEVHRYFVVAKRGEFAFGGASAHLHRLGDLLALPAPAGRHP
ncbi:acyl-CoA dehydrogenase [Saccharomonospora sp. CUA-673]|uniref:acyl-CoA dehydrogenase family protein n=1 Tax=Saccharomonospora sp. CUA-673 TaxID=1904969 RepID=UPI0009679C66|nr:acyl-CoA dehydrogenase family protein [Saccharomonospora sp. CUA-673]OLT48580.1 acyl-CoA dehydrogenase [Saccharomonospora sp. CUA-673]